MAQRKRKGKDAPRLRRAQNRAKPRREQQTHDKDLPRQGQDAIAAKAVPVSARQPSEPVELIASGYEWICPHDSCGEFNKVIEVREFVVCQKCKRRYRVQDYHHAIGK